MPLVVQPETGAGVVGADSYQSLADLTVYFTNIGKAAEWGALRIDQRESIARRAATYIDLQSLFPYSGSKERAVQGLQWPRVGASYWHNGPDIPIETVPTEVIKAFQEAARVAMDGPLPTEVAGSAATGGREVKKEKVDVIEVEYFHSTQGQAKDESNAPYGTPALGRLGLPTIIGYLLPLLLEDALNPQDQSGGVSMAVASRSGAWYAPANTPPAFERGMHDAVRFKDEMSRKKWP